MKHSPRWPQTSIMSHSHAAYELLMCQVDTSFFTANSKLQHSNEHVHKHEANKTHHPGKINSQSSKCLQANQSPLPYETTSNLDNTKNKQSNIVPGSNVAKLFVCDRSDRDAAENIHEIDTRDKESPWDSARKIQVSIWSSNKIIKQPHMISHSLEIYKTWHTHWNLHHHFSNIHRTQGVKKCLEHETEIHVSSQSKHCTVRFAMIAMPESLLEESLPTIRCVRRSCEDPAA